MEHSLGKEIDKNKYIELLENLVDDMDATGIDNICDCETFNDCRCCWIKASWEELQLFQAKNLGRRYARVMKRARDHDTFFTEELYAKLDELG